MLTIRVYTAPNRRAHYGRVYQNGIIVWTSPRVPYGQGGIAWQLCKNYTKGPLMRRHNH